VSSLAISHPLHRERERLSHHDGSRNADVVVVVVVVIVVFVLSLSRGVLSAVLASSASAAAAARGRSITARSAASHHRVEVVVSQALSRPVGR